jgi:hypothetical protein
MPKLREMMKQNAADYADHDGEEGPPRKIITNCKGKKRKYVYVKSVKSMEQVDEFRFKVIANNKN